MIPALSVEPLGSADRVALEGEVDIAAAPDLERQALRRIRSSRAVVVDLSGVRYLDSGGVRLLDNLVADCHRNGRPVRIVAPPANPALAILALCGFPRDLVEETVPAALAAIDAGRT